VVSKVVSHVLNKVVQVVQVVQVATTQRAFKEKAKGSPKEKAVVSEPAQPLLNEAAKEVESLRERSRNRMR